MFGLGATELIVIGVIALIFIGPKKLPELARSLGRGLNEFNRAKNDFMDSVREGEQEAGKEASKEGGHAHEAPVQKRLEERAINSTKPTKAKTAKGKKDTL